MDAYPNPFNPQITIAFETAVDGMAKLELYDVQGRRVRTLFQEVRPAGRQQVVWDGRDDSGHFVGSGVYVARLEAADSRTSKKITLVR